jgi:hypothetical protein
MALQRKKFKEKKELGWDPQNIYNRTVYSRHMTITREECYSMNKVPAVDEHLKKLAQDYRNTHSDLQTRYQEMTSAEGFLSELAQREAALMNRFRLLQQQLLAALKAEELEKTLELSRVFDEIRIINQFAIQTLTEANETENDSLQEV